MASLSVYFIKRILKAVDSCNCRRSMVVSVILYIGLFILVWAYAMPLHSPRPKVSRKSEGSTFIKIADVKQPDAQPADHIEGVRIERDGDINPNFRKEVLLGDDDEIDLRNPEKLLEEIFNKADTNQDGYLNETELSAWINSKIQAHLQQALRENFVLFAQIDNNPRNGVISWDEYHEFFLKQKGVSKEYVKKHDKKHTGLSRTIKESIARDRASWSEAARSNPDYLNLDEFLSFRHPESSHATILTLVDELLEKFDHDGDSVLTEDEFGNYQPEGDNGDGTQEQAVLDRKKEFREIIDRNSDGKADRRELLMYIDPRNPRHAKEESQTLILLADVDHDGQLSLREILNKMDLFLGSKMVNTGKSFHDEF